MPRTTKDSFGPQFIAAFVAIACLVAGAFFAYYQQQYHEARRTVDATLKTTAALRAGQVRHWRNERLGDGEVLRRNRVALEGLEQWLEGRLPGARAHLTHWLRGYVEAFDYESVQVLDAHGAALFVVGGPLLLSATARDLITQARASGQVALSDVQRDPAGRAYLDLVIPVPLADEYWTIDTVVLRIDPERTLFPLLRHWPVASSSAETLLLRNTGTLLEFQAPPRGAAPADPWPPVTHDDRRRVAAAAARGATRMDGVDYRNGPGVLAAAAPVAGSRWLLVTKIDEQEIVDEVGHQIAIAAAGSLVVVLAAAALLTRLWRRQRTAALLRLNREKRDRLELARLRNQQLDALEVAQLGSWERNLESGELWWSDEIRALLHLAADEEPSLDGFLARVHPDDRERVGTVTRRAYQSGNDAQVSYRALLPDGTTRHFHNRMRVIRDESGHPVRAVGTLQDVTTQHAIEHELQRRSAYLMAIVNHLPQGISVFDENLRLQYWNARLGEVLGLPPELLAHGVSFDELIRVPALRGEYGPGDPAEQVRERRALAMGFEPHRFERTRPTGTTHFVAGEPLFIDGKVAGFITTYTDITERKRVERELERQNHLLQTIIDHIPGGVSLIDGDLRLVTWNAELKRLLALPDALFAAGPPYLADILRFNAERGEYGPGDPAAITEQLVARARRPVAHSFERVRPDGQVLHVQGQPLPDGGFVTIYTDISERKRAERRLLLADTVFENSPEAIVVTDFAQRVVSVNPAHEAITGFAPHQAIGTTFLPADGDPAGDGAIDSDTIWAIVDRHGAYAGESRGRRANGETYPRWLMLTAVRDAHTRQITHFIAIFTDITERKRSEADIQHLAHHDTLTGLANRFSLGARLEQAAADARRNGQQLAVAFLDLDRFKNINDSLGHHVGDELLVQVAQRLATAVRETDTVARLGGDEFVVVLQGMRGSSGTAHVADKLLARLSEPYVVQGSELHTTPSIGISLFPDDSEEPATLLRNADTAMYHAKAAGRANYQFYTEEMNRIATARLDLERKLRQALARREFELWYQPQFASSDGALTGLEALVRWRHPEDGLIAPAHFIPLAEETGIIMEIGTWVLGEACRQLRHWLDTRLPAVRMSVNLSVRQLRDAHLADTVAAVLAGTGLSPGLLELEITESSVMDKPQKAIAVLTALKALGVRIAIDDFGTGHSSLSYLKLFPLDHLKIDRSFVSDIEHDANDAAIVAAAVSLAHNLGLRVVAEGVESAVQVARLRELGCDELQGYHFSRPLPAAEIEQFMRARLATPA